VAGRAKAGPVQAVAPPPPGRRGSGSIGQVDRVDEDIIEQMRKDGRISNRDLAKAIDVNEATIRSRIRKLETSHTMRIVAMLDLATAGYEFVAPVGIDVKGRPASEVADDLARIEGVMTVVIVIGPHDIEIQIAARTREELDHILTDIVCKIPGVSRLAPGLAMRVVKYESPWVPFA